MRRYFSEELGADTFDASKVFDFSKGPSIAPITHDATGEHRPDTRQTFEFFRGGTIDVDSRDDLRNGWTKRLGMHADHTWSRRRRDEGTAGLEPDHTAPHPHHPEKGRHDFEILMG